MLLFQVLCLLLLSVTALLLKQRPAIGDNVEDMVRFSESKWSNTWAVHIKGGREKANKIAESHGLVNLGQIGSLEDKYTFAKMDDSMISGKSPYRTYSADDAARDDEEANLLNDPEISFATHQRTVKHVKKQFNEQVASQNPTYQYQWFLKNTGQTGEEDVLLDINVVPAWNQEFSGQGILVGVVDDGVQSTHQDLSSNYDASNSYDFVDNDNDATPGDLDYDSHGTACAGVIGSVLSNEVCGVGVAYNSRIAGLRLLSYDGSTDTQDASALSYSRNNIDIYSNSWGPSDSGFIVEGPGSLTLEAFSAGAKNGRNGLGNIFTWAAGNGGDYYDSCAADGYVQSIYTIPVGAYNQVGGPAYYDEKCSAKMTVAYVENTRNESLKVATLDLNNACTLTFDGTSAATPEVSGVISLALEANPQLTWRDVQYLIVNTSNSSVLLNNTNDYFTNGAGLTVSHQFGFGAIDAGAMVTRAQNWNTVPSQITHTVTPSTSSGEATYSSPFISSFAYSGNIHYLEQFVVTMSLNVTGYTTSRNIYLADEEVWVALLHGNLTMSSFSTYIKRGDIEVSITSPSNTRSTLLFPRPYDTVNTEGYDQWPFRSVLHWGEDPNGQWTINVNWTNPNGGAATVEGVSVQFYGVLNNPTDPASTDSTSTSTVNPTKTDHTATSTMVRTNSDYFPTTMATNVPTAKPTESPTDGGAISQSTVSVVSLLLFFALFITMF